MTGGRVNRRDEGVARTRCHPSGPYKGLPGTFAVSTLWSGWNRSAIEPGPLRSPRDGPRDLEAAVLEREGVYPVSCFVDRIFTTPRRRWMDRARVGCLSEVVVAAARVGFTRGAVPV